MPGAGSRCATSGGVFLKLSPSHRASDTDSAQTEKSGLGINPTSPGEYSVLGAEFPAPAHFWRLADKRFLTKSRARSCDQEKTDPSEQRTTVAQRTPAGVDQHDTVSH